MTSRGIFGRHLSQHPFLFKMARVAFWTLVTSVALSALFWLFGSPLMPGCSTHLEFLEILPMYGVDIQCSGFPYAQGVAHALVVFLNWVPYTPALMFVVVVLAISLFIPGAHVHPLPSVVEMISFFSFVAAVFTLDAFALLYVVYLVSRLRHSTTYRKLVGFD